MEMAIYVFTLSRLHAISIKVFKIKFRIILQNFYLRLMKFIKNPKKSKFLYKEYKDTSKAIDKVLKCKGPWEGR